MKLNPERKPEKGKITMSIHETGRNILALSEKGREFEDPPEEIH